MESKKVVSAANKLIDIDKIFFLSSLLVNSALTFAGCGGCYSRIVDEIEDVLTFFLKIVAAILYLSLSIFI